ncbi:MAG TPA: HdeD family acid-resistance protein [Vicinamibacterales bacterium]|nr:HdeD family acid-resistance protein [Vicinamibacterales bacterium]
MTKLAPDSDDMQRAIGEALGAHWKLFLFQGVVLLILGILAVAAPAIATIAVDIYVGWLFLFGGVAGLVAIFSARNVPAFLWNLVTAALAAVIGVMLIWKPAAGALSLTLLLTTFFVVEGIFQLVASVAYRHVMRRSWGWMLVSGIADLVLAGIIVLGWPTTAVWALGLIVGINLITSGWAIVMTALSGRRLASQTQAPAVAAH